MNLKLTFPVSLRRAFCPSRLSFYALVLMLLYAAILPFFAGTDLHEADLSQARLAPSAAHWFGTDLAGHDLLVRVALGLRVSIFVAAVCAVVSTVIGVLIGAVAASWGGKVDSLLMRFTDTINALPQLLLGIAIVAFYPGSLVAIIASIALVHWSPVARIVRSIALSTRELEYVEAAYLAGASHWQVARKHLLPSVFGQMKVSVVLLFPHAIWHESTLSFLGLGISPDQPSLGTLLEVARTEILIGCWWELVFPAGALVLLTLLIFGWASGLGKASRGAARETDSAESDALVGDLSVPASDVPPCVHEAPAGEPDENTTPPALEFQDLSVTVPRSGWISDQRQKSLTGSTVAKPASTANSPTERDLVLEDHVNLQVKPGELHVLLGQSGAGKSILAKTATGMLPGKMQVSGQVSVGGRKLYGKNCPWQTIRGHLIAVASQSSATAFAPNHTVGDQLEESVKLLGRRDRAELLSGVTSEPATVTDLCEMTGFPTDSLAAYPHELSGGMLTRANLALALAGNPAVLIADEVTAGLDETRRDQIWQLLRKLADRGLAVLSITHDLALLLDLPLADQVTVLGHGQVLEQGTATQVLDTPRHPYTRELLAALPRNMARNRTDTSAPHPASDHENQPRLAPVETETLSTHTTVTGESPQAPNVTNDTVLEVRDLTVGYHGVSVVTGFNLSLHRGETVGWFGDSGCGKTTTARAIAGRLTPLTGRIRWCDSGETTTPQGKSPAPKQRPHAAVQPGVAMLFQSPRRSVNPRWTLGQIIEEPLVYSDVPPDVRRKQAAEICDELGIPSEFRRRFPAEVSEGQLQRVALARCLLTQPTVLICDEATAMLDTFSTASLVRAIQRRSARGLAVIAISHDRELLDYWADYSLELG
ncbi:ATP-binding cassette domain-containing protein [Mobiluncus curtisii]|uniref:ABC transporter ATP-binding protein/permease n=1 Tax=Mobiluncus curtisii TaxID=2051 RepID=UPI0014701809|nr:ATP-binding cassette domain-containing protein [Mobiluncus curtisii]NMW43644.1 ATP-binding cassette domain-containing protein [Mobiluncus curtisii]NMW99236.1 ATP-binding cassette domain-containing protein [Mobiluncus curtisii]NMX05518.1 ATP-binding cassette domain-containing protein [Mobiluncus curtisii]